jgi:hypothetical protein
MDSGHGPHSNGGHDVRISDVVDHDVRDPDDVEIPELRRPVLERLIGRLSPDPRVGRFSTADVIPRATAGTVHRLRGSSWQPDEPRVRACQADLLPEWLDRGVGIGN